MEDDLIIKTLNQHGEELHQHGEQLDIVIDKLGDHEERLVRIEEKVNGIDDRLVRVEGKLVKVEDGLVKIEDRLVKVELDVHHIKNEMVTKDDLRLLRNDILGNQDFLHKKLNDIHIEQVASNHTLLRHENELEKHGEQIRQLQRNMAGLAPQPNIA